MATDLLPPVHPGEVLLEEFLGPLELSQYRLAKDINVPPRRINEIVHGKRAISADTALRLARYFGTTERFWLNLQAQFDLDVVRVAVIPPETDPPLTVDANAVLASTITSQALETIARWHAQVIDAGRGVQHPQLAQGGLVHVSSEAADPSTVEHLLRVTVPEALDHDT